VEFPADRFRACYPYFRV